MSWRVHESQCSDDADIKIACYSVMTLSTTLWNVSRRAKLETGHWRRRWLNRESCKDIQSLTDAQRKSRQEGGRPHLL